MDLPLGVFAYRFEAVETGLLDLFAAGHQRITDSPYSWDGVARTDGPLLLFQYTWEGEGRYRDAQGEYAVPAGWGFLTTVPSEHRYWHPLGSSVWDQSFVLFRPSGAEDLWTAATKNAPTVRPFPAGSTTPAALETLVRTAAEGKIVDVYHASELVYHLLVALVRDARCPPRPPVPDAVAIACRILDSQIERSWSLAALAAEVQLSASHFHRIFHQSTGVTPLEWLTRKRMERAVHDLGVPGATVAAVARRLGYTDISYFIRVFRHWTGTTPGQIREQASIWAGSKIILSPGRFSDSRNPPSGVRLNP